MRRALLLVVALLSACVATHSARTDRAPSAGLRLPAEYIIPGLGIDAFHFSPDGRRVLVTAFGLEPARLLDAYTGDEIKLVGTGTASDAIFLGDGSIAVMSGSPYGGRARIEIWDGEAGAQIAGVELGVPPFGRTPDSSKTAAEYAPANAPENEEYDMFSGGSLYAEEEGRFMASCGSGIAIREQSTVTLRNRHLDLLWTREANASGEMTCNAEVVAIETPAGIDLLDIETGKGRRSLSLSFEEDQVLSLAFERRGARLAASTHHGNVQIWDTSTGETLTSRPAAGYGAALAFSPDGKLLVVGNAIYASTTLDIVRRAAWAPYDSSPRGARFSPDGRYLVELEFSASVVETAVAIRPDPLICGDHGVEPLAIDATESFAAIGCSGRVIIRNLATLEVVREIEAHPGQVRALAFLPDGSLLTAGSAAVHEWDVKTRARRRSHDFHAHGERHEIKAIRVSGDGSRILLLAETSARVITREGVVLQTFGPFQRAPAFHPDPDDDSHRRWLNGVDGDLSSSGQIVALSLAEPPQTTLHRVADGSQIGHSHRSAVTVRFDPSGDRIALATSQQQLILLSVRSGTETDRWDLQPPLSNDYRNFSAMFSRGTVGDETSFEFTNDGDSIFYYVESGYFGRLALLGPDPLIRWATVGRHLGVAWESRASTLWGLDETGRLRSWLVASGESGRFIGGSRARSIDALWFREDGDRLAVVLKDRGTAVWNIDSHRLEWSTNPNASMGAHVPAGQIVTEPPALRAPTEMNLERRLKERIRERGSPSFDGKMILFGNLIVGSDGRLVRALAIEPGRVTATAWSRDSRKLAIASDTLRRGGEISLYDVATGEVLATYQMADGNIVRVCAGAEPCEISSASAGAEEPGTPPRRTRRSH